MVCMYVVGSVQEAVTAVKSMVVDEHQLKWRLEDGRGKGRSQGRGSRDTEEMRQVRAAQGEATLTREETTECVSQVTRCVSLSWPLIPHWPLWTGTSRTPLTVRVNISRQNSK